jgi:hypothetical protein
MGTQLVDQQPQVGGTEHGAEQHEKKFVQAAGATATTEAIGAAAAVVLAIIGLAGALPIAMMSIATIVLGAAILLDAGAVGARHFRLLSEATHAEGRHIGRVELGGGISAGTIAGIAGIVLGIIALLGYMPITLCTIALIIFGAGLLLGGAAKGRMGSLVTAHENVGDRVRHLIDEATNVSVGGEIMIGLGAVVLGILALLGIDPLTLVLVGLLGVGAAVLVSGTAFGARMISVLRRSH